MKPEALDKLKKLAEYIERSCDEWYIKHRNQGEADLAFQRMLNFKMDIHDILKTLGEFDSAACDIRSMRRMEQYQKDYANDRRQIQKITNTIIVLSRRLGTLIE